MKGPDLTALFLSEIKRRGIAIEELEVRSGKTVFAKLANETCYLRYANLSIAGDFYFGFSALDVNRTGLAANAKKAILICGSGHLSDDIFVLDFDYFISLIKNGIPVQKKRADYEEYQAKIFPKRNYLMKITNARNSGVEMNRYRINLSDLVETLSTLSQSATVQPERTAEPPTRSEVTADRINRDSAVVRQLKQIYQNKCQICGHFITLPDGSRYSEAHHIRPLGGKHRGYDILSNLLCVCPNHHVELDYGCRKLILADLTIHPSHKLGEDNIEHHNNRLYSEIEKPR